MNQLNTGEIIEMVRFYGSVTSTEGMAQNLKELANKQLERLLTALNPEVDRVLAEAAGIKLV